MPAGSDARIHSENPVDRIASGTHCGLTLQRHHFVVPGHLSRQILSHHDRTEEKACGHPERFHVNSSKKPVNPASTQSLCIHPSIRFRGISNSQATVAA